MLGPAAAGHSINFPFLGPRLPNPDAAGGGGGGGAAVGSRMMPRRPEIVLPSAIDGMKLIISRIGPGSPGLMDPRP